MRVAGSANLLVCADAENVAIEAADRFAFLAIKSVAENGVFYAAVPGGSSPKKTLSKLAVGVYKDLIPWSRVHIFFTDERAVPPGHEDSNYRLVNELLVSNVPIPAENVHRFMAELGPAEAAERYEAELVDIMGDKPVFDLVMLGMGDDTHTASLFPNSPALLEDKKLAAANYVEKLSCYRLTLTLPAINNAKEILILAIGEAKAAAVHTVLCGEQDIQNHPVQAVKPFNGRLLWLLDREAASML